MDIPNLNDSILKSILHECRQCGTFCIQYEKIGFQPSFAKKQILIFYRSF